MEYDMIVTKLSAEDGGGFLAFVPDLPGCASDGETREEATVNCQNAIEEWIASAEEDKREIPQPGEAKKRALRHQEKIIELVDALSEALASEQTDNVSLRLEIEKLEALLHNDYISFAQTKASVEYAC